MNAEQLIQLSQAYTENHNFITNEETAKMALVVPFIRLLGYDPNMPKEVRPEYAADFTQGDGKKFHDRVDFAIFDKNGIKPLMIIEAKTLGTNLRAKSQQLARYISQLPDLHFGILTDGCEYQFYGDLESQNVMDDEPFFCFFLNDSKTDWSKVASFLSKFSREAFNAKTLITDAEDSRYKQAMVDKLVHVLRAPTEDEAFMKWLTNGIYSGKRTSQVMTRMEKLASEAIEPALLFVMEEEFVDKLKERIRSAREPREDDNQIQLDTNLDFSVDENKITKRKGIVTTDEELRFVDIVKQHCLNAGYDPEQVLLRDTVNYCNASYQLPTKWFIRYFGDSRKKNITTLVPTEEARQLAINCEVEDSPGVFGVSRIYINEVEKLMDLGNLITRSLSLLQGGELLERCG
jgi:predicted type IV restriction endonuclease